MYLVPPIRLSYVLVTPPQHAARAVVRGLPAPLAQDQAMLLCFFVKNSISTVGIANNRRANISAMAAHDWQSRFNLFATCDTTVARGVFVAAFGSVEESIRYLVDLVTAM